MTSVPACMQAWAAAQKAGSSGAAGATAIKVITLQAANLGNPFTLASTAAA